MPLRFILQRHNIRVTTKPLQMLQQSFPSPKYQVPHEWWTNVVYNIPCLDCSWSYIGETGRSFETQKKEHIWNVKNYKKGSNIANHTWGNNHNIGFANGNYRTRKALECWYTALIVNSDNNSKPLPRQYAVLVNKHCIH